MKNRSFPWTILIMTFVVCLLGGGIMQYMRYVQTTAIAELDTQLQEANAKAKVLRGREQKLQQSAALRADLEPRLLRLADGHVDGQLLMTVVRAARTSGVTPSPLTLGKGTNAGGSGLGLSFVVTGSEAQVLRFIALLEEGKPLAQVVTIQWGLPVEKGQDPNANSGPVTLQVAVFGDPADMQPAAAKPAPAKP